MQQDCAAIGIARVVSDGPCEKQIPLDTAAKLLEKAIDDAKDAAGKGCPKGCVCEGEITVLAPPQCYEQKIGEKVIHWWTLTVALDGKCKCPDDKPVARCKIDIDAKDYRDFFRKVEKLPTLPADPKGKKCQMYKHQKGHEFWWPICAGDCPQGQKCKTLVWNEGASLFACCECL
jgi:hypothetical protein